MKLNALVTSNLKRQPWHNSSINHKPISSISFSCLAYRHRKSLRTGKLFRKTFQSVRMKNPEHCRDKRAEFRDKATLFSLENPAATAQLCRVWKSVPNVWEKLAFPLEENLFIQMYSHTLIIETYSIYIFVVSSLHETRWMHCDNWRRRSCLCSRARHLRLADNIAKASEWM